MLSVFFINTQIADATKFESSEMCFWLTGIVIPSVLFGISFSVSM